MTAITAREAYVSYNSSDFDTTCRFYEDVLGCTLLETWDRDDGRGAYFGIGTVSLVEVFGAAHGAAPLTPPPVDAFAIVVVAPDVATARVIVLSNGGVPGEIVDESWGRHFDVADPDGICIYVIERTG